LEDRLHAPFTVLVRKTWIERKNAVAICGMGCSQARYNEDYGAMLVEVSGDVIHFQFINRQGSVIDDLELTKHITNSFTLIQQTMP
jgi:hypothetical protein